MSLHYNLIRKFKDRFGEEIELQEVVDWFGENVDPEVVYYRSQLDDAECGYICDCSDQLPEDVFDHSELMHWAERNNLRE